MNQIKSWFLENISEIDKSLEKPPKEKIKKTQITNVKSEIGDISTQSTDIKKKIRRHYKELHANTLKKIIEKIQFFKTQ